MEGLSVGEQNAGNGLPTLVCNDTTYGPIPKPLNQENVGRLPNGQQFEQVYVSRATFIMEIKRNEKYRFYCFRILNRNFSAVSKRTHC